MVDSIKNLRRQDDQLYGNEQDAPAPNGQSYIEHSKPQMIHRGTEYYRL